MKSSWGVRRSFVPVAALAVVLAGCGGGTDDTKYGDGDGASGTRRFEQLDHMATASTFDSQLDTEGARGFRFVTSLAYAGEAGSATRALYVDDDTAATYVNEVLATAATPDLLLSQLNAQGVRGYQFVGIDARGTTYRKRNGSTASYSYTALLAQAPTARTASFYQTQLDGQGALGFRLVAELGFQATYVNVYEQNTTDGSVYDVVLVAQAANDASQANQLDTYGAAGYRLKATRVFGGSTYWVYESDTSQGLARFSYALRDDVGTAAALVTQANTELSSDRAFAGRLALPSGVFKSLYVLPIACDGVLCQSSVPFAAQTVQ